MSEPKRRGRPKGLPKTGGRPPSEFPHRVQLLLNAEQLIWAKAKGGNRAIRAAIDEARTKEVETFLGP